MPCPRSHRRCRWCAYARIVLDEGLFDAEGSGSETIPRAPGGVFSMQPRRRRSPPPEVVALRSRTRGAHRARDSIRRPTPTHANGAPMARASAPGPATSCARADSRDAEARVKEDEKKQPESSPAPAPAPSARLIGRRLTLPSLWHDWLLRRPACIVFRRLNTERGAGEGAARIRSSGTRSLSGPTRRCGACPLAPFCSATAYSALLCCIPSDAADTGRTSHRPSASPSTPLAVGIGHATR